MPLLRPHLLLGLLACCGRVGFDEVELQVDGAPVDGAGDASANLLEGCALLLHMDEPGWAGNAGEVHDACGTDDAGTTVGVGATTIDMGVRGRGATFPGAGCIELGDVAELRTSTAVTMSAWVRPTGLDGSSALGIIAKRVDVDVGTEYDLFLYTGDKAAIDIGDERFAGATTFVNGAWRQLTAVYDGALPMQERLRVYVDGALDAIIPVTGDSIPPAMSPFDVGCLQVSGPAQYFVGDLDEVAVWTRALSPAEVAAWYTVSQQ